MLDVLANDSDVDSAIDPMSIEITRPPAYGTAIPMPDGTVSYTPDAGFRGAESFTYRVRDSLGLFSNEATVQLRINSAPNTNSDALVAKETITTVLDVLRNDNDPDGWLDPKSLVIVSGSDKADVLAQADGTIRFAPLRGFLGTTQFRYVVSDNQGRPSAPTDVSVRVVVSIYQNPRNRFDVDEDGIVSPLDVLVLINLLNRSGPTLPVDGLPGPPPYVDVNADNSIDPLDVLEVINHINSGRSDGGEGEGVAGQHVSQTAMGAQGLEISTGVVSTAISNALIRARLIDKLYGTAPAAGGGQVIESPKFATGSVARYAETSEPSTDLQLSTLDEYFDRLSRGPRSGDYPWTRW
jgi:hypothetical protein